MTRPIPAALHHTCFLVRDLEGTAQRMADALNQAVKLQGKEIEQPWGVRDLFSY